MYTIKGLDFVQTCFACPEQYDVFNNGEQVCYVRLRWGCLYAECPDVGGERVYEADIGDDMAGIFKSEDQRQYYLKQIAKAVKKWLENRDEEDADDEDDCIEERLYRIEFEVDNGVSYNRDAAIVKAWNAAEADEKLRRMIGSIDSETCVSRIYKTYVFDGEIFTGRHGWK